MSSSPSPLLMRRVLEVAPVLDERGFDSLVEAAVQKKEAGETALVDARHVRWADPYGMVGLLALGHHLRADAAAPPILQLPESPEVMSYFGRMGFLREAAGVFEIPGSVPARKPGGPSNVLLEITQIRSHEDVHDVIDHVQERAGTILTENLRYSRGDAAMFSMILSEVCQNIIEHAETGGWVGIQTYNWAKRLGRQVVVIGVVDLGVGFRGSLEREHAARHGERWSDLTALEAAFLHGVTRFRDPGRGQGLKQIRNRVHRWGGKVSIRSGTARIADIPPWDDAPAMQEGLAPFPGAQILIVLPAREDGAPGG
jgi:anti-sigma regulatory factor (Ser/Thr protein kinase)